MIGFRNKNKKVIEKIITPKPKVQNKEETKIIVKPKILSDDKSCIDNYNISEKSKLMLKNNGIDKLFPI